MTRGRRKHLIPRIPCRFYIRRDLLAVLELWVADPLRNKAKYGARNEFVEQAIMEKLETLKVRLTTDPVYGTIHGLEPTDGHDTRNRAAAASPNAGGESGPPSPGPERVQDD